MISKQKISQERTRLKSILSEFEGDLNNLISTNKHIGKAERKSLLQIRQDVRDLLHNWQCTSRKSFGINAACRLEDLGYCDCQLKTEIT